MPTTNARVNRALVQRPDTVALDRGESQRPDAETLDRGAIHDYDNLALAS
ncbi:MAG: hypothetical protein U0935_23145 [Pirellulales bacterium]